MSKIRFALAGLVLAGAVVLAAGPPPKKPAPKVDPASLDDRLDYLFLASDRPVTLRLHLRVGDKPYAQDWSVWVDKIFDWFDQDKSGYLEAKEATRLPQPQTLIYHLQGSIGGFFGGTVPMTSLDTNKDGKASRDELRAFFRRSGLGALRLNQNNFQANEADKINKAIYARVNKKKDGKLTQADAARLPDLMATLDENEDELLVTSEINTRADGGYYAEPFEFYDGMRRPAVQVDYGLIDIKETPRGELVKKLLTAYDRNKDGKLSAAEIGLDKAGFAALDKYGDGQLDAAELPAYFDRAPDIAVRAKVGQLSATTTVVGGVSKFFGRKAPAAQRAEVVTADGRATALAKLVRRVDGDNLAMKLGDSEIAMQVTQGFGGNSGAKQFYLEQYDSIADKKESIDRRQVQGNYYLNQMFNQADKNTDGKLTRKELAEWLDLMSEGSGKVSSLALTDNGRPLFAVVDTNRNGSLSVRELRTAWDRMKPLLKDKEGLRVADMPRSLSITLNQGMYNYGGFRVAVTTYGAPSQPATWGSSTPLWFRKMDRNGDGDVSPKEWLGTEDEFREIDTDGDQLLSGEEARAFEARRRKEQDAAKEEKQEPPVEKKQ